MATSLKDLLMKKDNCNNRFQLVAMHICNAICRVHMLDTQMSRFGPESTTILHRLQLNLSPSHEACGHL